MAKLPLCRPTPGANKFQEREQATEAGRTGGAVSSKRRSEEEKGVGANESEKVFIGQLQGQGALTSPIGSRLQSFSCEHPTSNFVLHVSTASQ